jgi:hypothetical protein
MPGARRYVITARASTQADPRRWDKTRGEEDICPGAFSGAVRRQVATVRRPVVSTAVNTRIKHR